MKSDNLPQNDSTHLILAQLKDIASAVMYAAEGGTLEQVLERIAHVSKELVNARYAALGVPDNKGGLRYFKVAGLSHAESVQIGHLPTGRGLLGAIMRERKTIRLERMADDSRSAGFCAAHPPMSSLLGVPVQVGQQLFGTLYLCDRLDGQPFSEQDEWLVETMAGYAALAIGGSQLNAQQQRLNLLEERQRIGMELHDGVIQSLYAIGMNLDLMRLNQNAKPNDLNGVIVNLNEVIEDIRRYIMDLQTRHNPQQTVAQGLRDVLNRLHVPEHLTIELHAPDVKPRFTPMTFEAICQMANEALSNAIRHAEASHIQVQVEQRGATFTMIIVDNGKGFDLNALNDHQGLGLRNIHHRALLHGGKVHIESAPGQGTRLTVTVPVQLM